MEEPSADPEWSEERLGSLIPYEHDRQEFKGAHFIHSPGERNVRSDFLDHLSKQVSAFANAGGGLLFLGIDDQGAIDGGVPMDLRLNGTREWLEDVLPGAVDPPLKRFNVHEVRRSGRQSAIRRGHAVYVLELPESEDAPHMARDRRYYLRIAGKSRPMSHRLVLDILQRRRDPEVWVSQVDPYGEPEFLRDPRGPLCLLRLRLQLHNRGRALAHHVGVEVTLPRYSVNGECRRRTLGEQGATLSQSPGEVTYFFYHPIPVFPKQALPFAMVWVAIHRANLHHYAGGRASLRWRVYADAARAKEGQVEIAGYSVVQRGLREIEQREP